MTSLGQPDPVGILAGETVDPTNRYPATLQYRCIYCVDNAIEVRGESVYVRDTGTRRFVRTEERPTCSEHGATFVSINSCYARVPDLQPL